MTRKLIDKVHDKARAKAMEEISSTYPELWEFLLAKRVEEYRHEDHPTFIRYDGDPSKVYDSARRHAKLDLKELRPGAWSLLIWGWTAHFKEELGWSDGRAEANKERDYTTPRGEGGKFASAR